MIPITKETIKKFIQKLQKQGDAPSLILKKLIIVNKFLTWSYQKNLIEADVFKQIKEEIDNIKSKIEDKKLKEETILITESPKFIPQIADLEKAAYAGEKKSEGIFGEISLRFHLQTYKIKSFLFGLLKKVPLLDSRFPFNKKEELKEKKAPSGFDFSNFGIHHYIGFLFFLIFLGFLGAGLYNHFFLKVERPLAYPINLTRGGRALSFQGRLTDSLGNPITTATNVQFKLYNVSTGGTPLYTAGPCSITPDQDGIFSTLIGQSCGSEIPNSVFTENPNVYLGVTVGADSEMTPRQPIANVGYAINAETLQGFPPGQGKSSIPFINKDGDLLIAVASPGIRSTFTSADFTLSSAKTAIIQSAGSGDVVLQATESGALRFRTGGNNDTYTRMIINNNGNVGIGTTNPSTFKLQVDGNVGPNPGGSYNLGSSTYPWANLYASNIYLSGFTPGSVIFAGASGLLSQNNSQFFWDNTNSRLGIGTNSFTAGDPSLKLEVAGNIYVDKLIDRNNTSYGIDPAGNTLLGNYSLYTAYGAILAGASGNVGIGTTSPNQTLSVAGTLGILEGGASPQYYTIFQGGDQTADITYTLPTSIVANGFLRTDASGVLSWTTTIPATSVAWSNLTDPTANLSLNHSTYTTTFNWSTGTGTNNLFSLTTDASANGTGSLLNIQTGTSSTVNPLQVRAGSTEALFVNSSGNVGIGTTGPGYKLDVAGTFRVLGSNYDVTVDSTGNFYAPGQAVVGGTGLAGQLRVVSISTGGRTQLVVDNDNTGAGSRSSIILYRGGGVNRFELGNDRFVNGTNDFYLYDVVAGEDRLYVGSTGNIGIGTTSPGSRLEVRGSTSNSSASALNITNSGGTSLLYVRNDGSVGIGTTSPGATLHIAGSAGSLPAIASVMSSASTTLGADYPGLQLVNTNTTTNNFAYISFADTVSGNSSSAIATQFTDHTNDYGDLLFATRSSGGLTEKMRITSTGNVGIGTTGPGATLDVRGDVRFLSQSDNQSRVFFERRSEGGWIFPSLIAGQQRGIVIKDSPGLAGGLWLNGGDHNGIGSRGGIGVGLVTDLGTYRALTASSSFIRFHDGQIIFYGNTGLTPGNNFTPSETMRINAAGNVGIGTMNPGTNKLYVSGGDVYMTNDLRAARFIDITGSDTYYLDPANGGNSLVIAGNIVSRNPTPYITGFDGTNYNTLILVGSDNSTSTSVCISYSGEPASCSGKIDAGTVDPPYTINGKKYATYVPSMTGVKEETTGVIEITSKNKKLNAYEYIIDFAKQKEGSDLWLFSKTTNLRKNIDKMTVLLTPSKNTRVWYKIDKKKFALFIYSTKPTTISYRLTAPRFDYEKWTNENPNGPNGFVINDPDLPSLLTLDENGNVQEATVTLTSTPSGQTGNLWQDLTNKVYQLAGATQDLIEEIGYFQKILVAKIQTGLLQAEEVLAKNLLVAKNIVAENINLTTKNITIAGKTIERFIDERIETFVNLRLISFNSQKIISPVVETSNLKATGEASLNTISTNEIKPQEKDLVINLDSEAKMPVSNYLGGAQRNDSEASTPTEVRNTVPSERKGPLAKIIIKGLEGKTAATIDAAGNASFSGQISSSSIVSDLGDLGNLKVKKDATISGALSTNTLNATEASVSGKIIAKEIEAENINEIQRLLAEIKNQPLPNLSNLSNLSNLTNLSDLTVTGQSNLYNVSVSGSLLVGQTFFENNSITTLASELKLSALDKITLFDGAVTIAKDGAITTKGEIIAQSGIKTSKITPLEKDLSVLGNISVLGELKLKKATGSAVIAAPDNLAKNGIFAPAIEASASAAGVGIIPKNSQEVIIYSSFATPNSLIYLTPKTAQPISLSVFDKKDGFFRVIRNELLDQDVSFDWLIIN